MRLSRVLCFILGLACVVSIQSNAEAQNMERSDSHKYFRSAAAPHTSFGLKPQDNPKQLLLQADARTFFTVTLTAFTSTSYTTLTSTTVCTTSTSALKVCTPSGRRRRSVAGGRGLFYSDHDAQAEEGSIFLSSPIKVEESESKIEKREVNDNVRGTGIPFVPQPGFKIPNGAPSGAGRFLLTFGTKTIILTTSTTYISSLTAICQSTTAYQLCGTTGK